MREVRRRQIILRGVRGPDGVEVRSARRVQIHQKSRDVGGGGLHSCGLGREILDYLRRGGGGGVSEAAAGDGGYEDLRLRSERGKNPRIRRCVYERDGDGWCDIRVRHPQRGLGYPLLPSSW